jgi:hypothetical protein
MENIMSKTNDTSNLGRATQNRELHDHEMDAVSGGLDVTAIIGGFDGQFHPGLIRVLGMVRN